MSGISLRAPKLHGQVARAALPKIEPDPEMSAENLNKIKEIFLEARQLAPAERGVFLEQKCDERGSAARKSKNLMRGGKKKPEQP